VRVFSALDDPPETVLQQISDLLSLTLEQVRTAVRYYGEYADEINDWMRRVAEEADQAEAAWRHERDLLQQ
jgi:hypothetical protein